MVIMSFQLDEMRRMEQYCESHRNNPANIARKQSVNYQMSVEIARRAIGCSSNKHRDLREFANEQANLYK